MRKLIMLAVSFAATFVLALAGPASARTRVEISTTAFLISGRITFEATAEAICDITLHVTAASRLISKTLGTQIGRVSSILTANPRIVEACGALLSLPMLVLYVAISGTLPTITGISVFLQGGFFIRDLFIGRCLYLGPILVVAAENPVRRARAEGREVRLFEGGATCPRDANLKIDPTTLSPEVTILLLET